MGYKTAFINIPILLLAIFLTGATFFVPKTTYAAFTCPDGQQAIERDAAHENMFSTSPNAQYLCITASRDGGTVTDTYYRSDGTQLGSGAVIPVGGGGPVIQTDESGKTITRPATCGWSPTDWTFEGCVWNPLMGLLGRLLLSLGGFILWMAGGIFDALIQHVIVGFKQTLDSLSLTAVIAKGWTVFRDFANILIIGMFVFIAISIILGIKEYGQKKLIANVLIVAVLINFSLLFTRLIIDASNFTAFQIYAAMQPAKTPANPTGGFDIAQAFLTPMGITSIWNDSGKVVNKLIETNQSGLQGLIFGFIGGVMLTMVAAVLLYGCFLIAARAVLLIFLMITAALAFASYLIPSMAKGKYGFDSWWKTLLNSAIFAPLIMLFLAVSLAIITAARSQVPPTTSGTSTLGGIMASPTVLVNGDGWTTILLYILGTGLLFLSFRLSSSFAGSISGFSLAAALTAAPVTLASRFAAAPLARGLIGGRAFKAAESLTGQAKAARLGSTLETAKAASYNDEARRKAAAGDHVGAFNANQNAASAKALALAKEHDAAHLLEQAAKKKATADRKFNPMDTVGAKAFNKSIGNTGVLSGQTGKEKSYAATIADRAKHAAETAAGAKVSDAEKDTLREQARRDAEQRRESDVERARSERETAATNLQAAVIQRDAAKTERDNKMATLSDDAGLKSAQEEMTKAIKAKSDKEDAHNTSSSELRERIKATIDPETNQKLRVEFEDMQTDHAISMKAEDSKIASINRTVQTRMAEIEKERNAAEGALAAATTLFQNSKSVLEEKEKAVTKINEEVKALGTELGKQYIDDANTRVANIAEQIGRADGSPLNKVPVIGKTLGNAYGQSDDVAKGARDLLKKKQGAESQLGEMFKTMNIGTPPATPPAGDAPAH